MHSKKFLLKLLKENPGKEINFKHINMNGNNVYFEISFEFNPNDKETPFHVRTSVFNTEINDYQKQAISISNAINFIFSKHCGWYDCNDEDTFGYDLNEELFLNLLSFLTFKNFEKE